MACKYDLTGLTFERFTVLQFDGQDKHRASMWLCACKCGTTKRIRGAHLRQGLIKSCGCHAKDLARRSRGIVHGHARSGKKTPEFLTYLAAKARCSNKKNKWYGARGIEFRFSSFQEFLAELGSKPSSKYSVDRINNNGHYERGNVRWATQSEQLRNRRGKSV